MAQYYSKSGREIELDALAMMTRKFKLKTGDHECYPHFHADMSKSYICRCTHDLLKQ